MAIKIEFDNTHNVLKPTLVLATRKGRKLGSIPAYNIVFKDCLNTYADFSFRVNKEDCKSKVGFWEQLLDFKLLWVREWNRWFELYVEIDESNDTIKNVSAKSLGEAELSQINLYGIEINTEVDISREDYEPTVLYKGSNPNASLLTRITEKIPHYTIRHVDATIANVQRTFSFDGKTIYDVFQEIAEEINCLFIIDCYSDSNGNIIRDINVYDLESNCLDCGERGEFSNTCPSCGSSNITMGYGTDTTIFVSTDNLADDITFSTDNGSVKNCFKLEAGDDLMTATITNCNPNGSSYIWYISDAVREDMSLELATKLEQYDKDYAYYRDTYQANISGNYLTAYNTLVEKYEAYTSKYNKVTSPIVGYSKLMEIYYDTIDFYLYLNNNMMPSIEISETSADMELKKLTASNLSPVAVRDLSTCSKSTADSSVLAIAKTIVNKHYQVKITESTYSGTTWSGKFNVVSYSDNDDSATSSNNVTIVINDNYERYVKQKIDRSIRQSVSNDEITDIIGLFSLGDNTFKDEIKKYCLSRLKSFHDTCQTCIDVLTEQGVGNKSTWGSSSPNLYETLYVPYYKKLGYLEAEMKLRENEIAIIVGVYDSNGYLTTNGFQTILDIERNKIHDCLNFEKYLGNDLWLEFSAYRREDTYKNDNYISDGLDNAALFENARKFIAIAEKEIYKSATLQHSISATLKNLLVMQEFAPIVNYFEVGNWIRIRVDNSIYRLRLLDYEIDFDNLNNISITFSDVTIISTGQSDVGSVLNQASSMASSYDTTKRQAETSKNRLDDWVHRGLDATNVKIMNNADNQNQTWDSHGMLFRQYDSITDSYDDTQLKILNSTLAVTDDNWETIKTAVGGFYYYDPITGKLKYAYGINAEMVIGKIILGEQLGIYSENNSLTFDRNGLLITNNINSFSVNPNSNNLLVLSNDKGDIFWVDNKGGLHIIGDGNGLDITANSTISGMSSRIDQTAESITLEVTRATDSEKSINENVSSLKQYVDSITLEVSNGSTSSSIQLKAGETVISSKDINFNGYVTFTGLSGGTTIIDAGCLQTGTINSVDININDNFIVDSMGNVTMNGNINWGTDNSPVLVLYARTELSTPTSSYTSYTDSSSTEWHKTLDITYDFYVSYSYDGGSSWTNAMKVQGIDGSNGNDGKGIKSTTITYQTSSSGTSVPTGTWSTSIPSVNAGSYLWTRTIITYTDNTTSTLYSVSRNGTNGSDGKDGKDGADGADGSDANVTRGNIARALYEGSSNYYNDGIYSYYYYGKYYLAINAGYILAGDINADNIALTCDYGGFAKGYGSDGENTTFGSMMYGKNGKGYTPYIIVTNSGARMSGSSSMEFYITKDSICATEAIQIGSDKRIKNSINYDMSIYENFFNSLKPTQYRLNNGESGRFHLGFIAQDVEQALLDNGLKTSDFAGLCIETFNEGFEKDGISSGYYHLRYEEFISLNTYMIQKLYKEIDSIKEEICLLKGE